MDSKKENVAKESLQDSLKGHNSLQTKSSEIIDDENVFVSQVQRVDLNDGIDLQDELEKKNIEIDDLNIKLMALQEQLNEKVREIVELKNRLKQDELKTNVEELITGPGEPILPHEGPLVFLNHSKIPDMRYFPVGNMPFSAIFENIPSEGPDWMLIHRRFDGSVDFGATTKTFTSSCRHELYIELVDFDNVKAFAKYDHFEIGPQEDYYNLKSPGAYSGNAGDALRLHLNCTYGNEKKIEDGVSKKYYWWGSANSMCDLNGPYYKLKTKLDDFLGIFWGDWYINGVYSLKSCKMLIRPHDWKSKDSI